MTQDMFRSALLSCDKRYRYDLRRRWAATPVPVLGGALLIIGLNPSTADAYTDDPTIRRCIGFAKGLGYGSLLMGNLFAYRATSPLELLEVEDPVGPDTNWHLQAMAKEAAGIIVAWGAFEMRRPLFTERAREVTRMLSKILLPYCFGTTKDGHPKHPLYLRADTPIELYRSPR